MNKDKIRFDHAAFTDYLSSFLVIGHRGAAGLAPVRRPPIQRGLENVVYCSLAAASTLLWFAAEIFLPEMAEHHGCKTQRAVPQPRHRER